MADPLLWVDLETTGTDETKDSIIEIGVVATMADLSFLGEFSAVVRPTAEGLGRLYRTDVVREMHAQNGLLQELLDDIDTTPPGVVERDLLETMHGIHEGQWILAGSGVGHFDRRFLAAQMPMVERRLRHWCIDVGVVRRAYSMWTGTPERHPSWVDGKTHRALDDVRFHVEEARMWRELFVNAEQDARLAR